MEQEIRQILSVEQGLTGREIAKRMKSTVDKTTVNRFLAENNKGLRKEKESGRWYLISKQHILEFPADTWICEELFESAFKEAGCFFNNSADEYIIRFPKRCRILLIAGARIIALVNQCVHQGKKITLDFSQCSATKTYLDRLGFFDHLSAAINVSPKRPAESRAVRYSGNSENLVEIAAINPKDLDESIPKTLTNKFINLTDDKYRTPIFTVFSELIGNVRDHSDSPIMGFAALQKYKGSKEHIQVVVSDSGLGILQTLKPRLNEHYPELYRELDFSKKETDTDLLKKIFIEGQLSQFGSNPDGEARGLGLKKSQDYAARYNADITIRQKTLQLKLIYRNGQLFEAKPKFDLSILNGTQVCFDFYLN